MESSWSSTPTCTPARAGILTGRRPWGHGMLGYGEVSPHYAISYPQVLQAAGYSTHTIGKDHFGWNETSNSGISHGYSTTTLYDGSGFYNANATSFPPWQGEFDNYDAWWLNVMPGKNPQATMADVGYDIHNGWKGRAWVYDEDLHPTAWVGRRAEKFLRQAGNNQTANASAAPFLLKISFHRPHSPYDPPQRVLDKIPGDALSPIQVCEDSDPVTPGSDGGWCDRFRGGQNDPIGCENTEAAWCGLRPENETILSRRAYLASVAFVDEQIVKIYDTLAETGLLENTLILFSADHGDGQGQHYHWRKGYPYEFSAHVPMFLRWPESWAKNQSLQGTPVTLARGSSLAAPLVTELRDVFHTLVDAAGLADALPKYNSGDFGSFSATDGKSLLCLLKDPSGDTCDYAPNPGPWRTWVDLEHDVCYNMTNHWSAQTDGKMKYIFRAWTEEETEQLFNLTADPYEKLNVVGVPSYQPTLIQWRNRMIKQFQTEQRGLNFVSADGVLVKQREKMTYGPNYPKLPQAKPGDPLSLELAPKSTGSDNDISSQDEEMPCDFGYTPTQCWGLRNNTIDSMNIKLLNTIENMELCLSVSISNHPHNDPTNDPGLSLSMEKCDQADKQQGFQITNQQTVVHLSSGLCVTTGNNYTSIGLNTCSNMNSKAETDYLRHTYERSRGMTLEVSQGQIWKYTTSGRFCQNNTSGDEWCWNALAQIGPG